MDLKNLFADEGAVSPVIGVILMVAITVILAAVIGAFVLGIGSSQEQTPQASWEWETQTSDYPTATGEKCGSTSGSDAAKVTHKGGDEIDGSNLALDGGDCSGIITAGTSLYNNDVSTGQVSLVWSSPSSDTTNILSSFEV